MLLGEDSSILGPRITGESSFYLSEAEGEGTTELTSPPPSPFSRSFLRWPVARDMVPVWAFRIFNFSFIGSSLRPSTPSSSSSPRANFPSSLLSLPSSLPKHPFIPHRRPFPLPPHPSSPSNLPLSSPPREGLPRSHDLPLPHHLRLRPRRSRSLVRLRRVRLGWDSTVVSLPFLTLSSREPS